MCCARSLEGEERLWSCESLIGTTTFEPKKYETTEPKQEQHEDDGTIYPPLILIF